MSQFCARCGAIMQVCAGEFRDCRDDRVAVSLIAHCSLISGGVVMIVGVPKEVKDRENRVGMTPAGVAEIAARGARVLVEQNAGSGSGYADAEYERAGAEIVPTAADAWGAE